MALREAARKKHDWYDEQIEKERQLSRGVEIRLNNEMGRLEQLYDKESKIWEQLKTQYEEVTMANKRKIDNLKKDLEDL